MRWKMLVRSGNPIEWKNREIQGRDASPADVPRRRSKPSEEKLPRGNRAVGSESPRVETLRIGGTLVRPRRIGTSAVCADRFQECWLRESCGRGAWHRGGPGTTYIGICQCCDNNTLSTLYYILYIFSTVAYNFSFGLVLFFRTGGVSGRSPRSRPGPRHSPFPQFRTP
jgi:hypothetical protein